jgi:hypothetical protein
VTAAPSSFALIDESFRVVQGGHYLLAAALIRADEIDETRAAIRAAIPSTLAHFRWAKENEDLRAKMLSTVDSLDLRSLVVVTTPVVPRRQERARALCIERMVWELRTRDKRMHLLFESRGNQDVADRRVLAGLQRRQVMPEEWTYGFGTKADPALWIPDAVGGVVMARRCERADTFADALGALTVIEIGTS